MASSIHLVSSSLGLGGNLKASHRVRAKMYANSTFKKIKHCCCSFWGRFHFNDFCKNALNLFLCSLLENRGSIISSQSGESMASII